MRPLQHPSVIEHWSTAEWTRGWVLPARVMIGWVFPLLFAVETYRTVHETTSGFHALLAATLIFGIVYAVEAGYVLASGPLAEALGVVADVACLVVPWMPLLGVRVTLIAWVAATIGTAAAVKAGRLVPRPRHVVVGVPASLLLAWAAGIMLTWARGLTVPSLPGIPGGTSMVLLAVAVVVSLGAGAAKAGTWVVGLCRAPTPLPRSMRGEELEEFLGTVKHRLVDGPHPIPGHEDPTRQQSLYALPRQYGDVRFLVTANGTKNPATDTYEHVGLRASLTCDTAMDAVAETYGQTGPEYALTERRT